ncbi:MAG: hypothetical protein ACOYOQ_00490 [Microthrixaceae bacterium]
MSYATHMRAEVSRLEAQVAGWRDECADLQLRNRELAEENRRLRQQLAEAQSKS